MTQPKPSAPPQSDVILATLGGAAIRESEFQAYTARFGSEQPGQTEATPERREASLTAFLDQRVMTAKARKEGIPQDTRYKKACQLLEMNQLIQALQGRDRPMLLKALEVTEAELKADYEARQDLFRKPEGGREPFEKVRDFILDRLTHGKRAARNKAYLEPIKAEVGLKVMPIVTDPNAGDLAVTDPLLATLGKEEIHDSDFQWFLRDAFQPKQRLDINAQPGQRREMMQSYLNMRALEAKARKDGLDKTEDFQKTRAAAQEALLVEFLMGRVNETLRKEAIPTEDELKAYHQQNPDSFRPIPCFSARQVLVAVKGQPGDPDYAAQDAMAKAKAEEALNRLRAGESWETIANIFSDDAATKGTGGLIKHASFSSLAPELDQAVRTQEMGKPMGPVKSALGYHIIQVDMRVTEKDVEPFETVRAEIVKRLSPVKLEEAQKAYTIRLRSEMGLVRKAPASQVHPSAPRLGDRRD